MLREFELSASQYDALLEASKPVPVMYLSGGRELFRSPQENANDVWQRLGRELGFVWDSVRPAPGKGARFFLAEPTS